MAHMTENHSCELLTMVSFSIVRFKGDVERASTVYKGLKPLTGADIADVILYVLSTPDHVVIADLVVFPKAQASAVVVKRENG